MVRDIAGQSWNALRHNRRRSVLTMLGMAWGIATVVILLAWGSGFENAIFSLFRSFGTNLIAVIPGRTSLQAGGTKAGTEIRLTLADVDLISSQVASVRGISPDVDKESNIQHDNRTLKYLVSGVYPVASRINNLAVSNGRFYNIEEEAQHSRVAVIGSKVKEKLFSGQNALGDSIRIDGIRFTVVGILDHQVNGGGDDDRNAVVYVPFSSMGALKDTRYLTSILLDYNGAENLKVVKSIRALLAYNHSFRPEDRRALRIDDIVAQMQEFRIITTALKVLLAFIGTLTLGIGGVGLMNIMLVSVQQRTREIGVEKALGARKRHILMQFLAEALAITSAGGIAGIVLAYIVSWSVGGLTLFSAFGPGAEEYDIHLIIDPTTLVVATVLLGMVGLISGMLPAIRASHLDPVEALRYE